jgi:hypothetical protein
VVLMLLAMLCEWSSSWNWLTVASVRLMVRRALLGA